MTFNRKDFIIDVNRCLVAVELNFFIKFLRYFLHIPLQGSPIEICGISAGGPDIFLHGKSFFRKETYRFQEPDGYFFIVVAEKLNWICRKSSPIQYTRAQIGYQHLFASLDDS